MFQNKFNENCENNSQKKKYYQTTKKIKMGTKKTEKKSLKITMHDGLTATNLVIAGLVREIERKNIITKGGVIT